MATANVVNGTLIAIYKDVSGTLTKIANATSNDFDVTKDMIDVTNKDSAGWKGHLHRPRSGYCYHCCNDFKCQRRYQIKRLGFLF